MKLTRETRQKEILIRELEKLYEFFTAEDLHKKVSKEEKIGIATVYRFLKELRTKGQVHSYLCDRKTLYSKKESSHCHFTCEKCGKKEHFSVQKLDLIKEKLNGTVCHFQLDVVGICEECSKKQAQR